MFIGEITDMEVLSDIPSVTYEYYQNNIKPKPEEVGKTEDGQTIWRCRICGYEYVGEELNDQFEKSSHDRLWFCWFCICICFNAKRIIYRNRPY